MAQDIGNSWREVCDTMEANEGRNHNHDVSCAIRPKDDDQHRND